MACMYSKEIKKRELLDKERNSLNFIANVHKEIKLADGDKKDIQLFKRRIGIRRYRPVLSIRT